MRRRLGEVDVVSETMLAGAFRQAKQCSPASTADHNDDAMMWLRHCEMEKIVPVAGQQQATAVVGKLEDGLVGGIARKGFTQERDIVTELLEQVAQAVGHRRGRAGTSLRSQRHLPGNEQIDFSSVVLIVG